MDYVIILLIALVLTGLFAIIFNYIISLIAKDLGIENKPCDSCGSKNVTWSYTFTSTLFICKDCGYYFKIGE